MPGEATSREIEFKLLVENEAVLDAVARAAEARGARAAAPARQVNHFFDSPAGELRARDSIVRLRDEDGAWTLCAKGAVEQGSGEKGAGDKGAGDKGAGDKGAGDAKLHVRAELEHPADAAEARAILAGEADPLELLEAALGERPLLASMRAAVGADRLVPAGSFENRRTRVGPLPVGEQLLFLELDRTSFPGEITHTEVELEVPAGLEGAADALLRELFAEAGAEGRAAPSKSARFFRALDGEPI